MQLEPLCRAGSSEFPHDNPAFDRGTLWIGTSLCCLPPQPRVERPPHRPPAGPPPPPPEPLAIDLVDLADKLAGGARQDPVAPPAESDADVVPSDLLAASLRSALGELPATASPSTAPEIPDLPLPSFASEMLAPTLAAPASETPLERGAFGIFVDAVAQVAGEHGGPAAGASVACLLAGEVPPLTASAEALLSGADIVEHDAGTLRATASFVRILRAWQGVLCGTGGDLSACGEHTLDTWAADLVCRVLCDRAKQDVVRRDLRRHGIAAFGMLQ